MEEQKWVECSDPTLMLNFLDGKATERKFRLFACGCCRRIWDLIQSDLHRRAVEVAEQLADGAEAEYEAMRNRLAAEHHSLLQNGHQDVYYYRYDHIHPELAPDLALSRTSGMPWSVQDLTARLRAARHPFWEQLEDDDLSEPADEEWHRRHQGEMRAQANLLRDIFGNPFHPVVLDGGLRTPALLALAQSAYDNRTLPAGTLEPERLAILADALEETGCTDAHILGHLRGPGPHTRGCWPVDLLLCKE